MNSRLPSSRPFPAPGGSGSRQMNTTAGAGVPVAGDSSRTNSNLVSLVGTSANNNNHAFVDNEDDYDLYSGFNADDGNTTGFTASSQQQQQDWFPQQNSPTTALASSSSALHRRPSGNLLQQQQQRQMTSSVQMSSVKGTGYTSVGTGGAGSLRRIPSSSSPAAAAGVQMTPGSGPGSHGSSSRGCSALASAPTLRITGSDPTLGLGGLDGQQIKAAAADARFQKLIATIEALLVQSYLAEERGDARTALDIARVINSRTW